MNPAIGAFIGVSKQTEMLLMTVLALWVNIFDMAIFEISSNLDAVWNVEIDRTIFNSHAEYVIRMLLSGVVLIRTFTLHLYIAFLIAVFWPVCFGTRPTLMLPWLVVSAIKNLGTGLVSIATGGYTCMIYGPLRPACVRFLLSQIIDLSPSFYMWFVGLSLYCDLKKPKSVTKLQIKAMEDQELNVALRRRKVKSMIDEDILRQQFESRSIQKKFLGTSAVEVNEFINRCSYDNLKNKFSRSLDSLLDVLTVQTELLDIEDNEPLEIDSSSTLQQKTAKLLGISMAEIDCIKQNRQTRPDFPAYPVQPQKKIQAISLINSRYESPAKLLPETSLYTPPNKPIRVTKSELKSPKGVPQLETVAEKEMQVLDLSRPESDESFQNMQTVFQSNHSLFKNEETPNADLAKTQTTIKINEPKLITDTKDSGNKNHDRSCCSKQNRGKLQEVQVENPTKYKFSNTLSDKSHQLLDEYCFLFDKESMLKKGENSKVVSAYGNKMRPNEPNTTIGKQKNFLSHYQTFDVATTLVTKPPDNTINNKPNLILDEKPENKTSKIHTLKRTKDDVLNKKNLKLSEKTQPIKKKIITKKIPTGEFTNIPVLNRCPKIIENTKNTINERKCNISANRRNWLNQEKKLDTIEEYKDSINEQDLKSSSIFTVIEYNATKKNNLEEHTILNDQKPTTFLVNKNKIKENNDDINKIKDEEAKNNIKNILLNEERSISSEEYRISVSAEIERLNKKNLNMSAIPRKDIFKSADNNKTSTSEANKVEILNRKNYLRSIKYEIPSPFLALKHSPIKIALQKEAIKQEPKLISKEENKPNKLKTLAMSEKILHRKEKTAKMDKTKIESLFGEKHDKTDLFKPNDNKNAFDPFIAASTKIPARSKQLEFHFKEKISKTRDYKMEDLFKKKTDKTNDRDKASFPSYFSNKINRMITDACQIRKKSCKKINLFAKVPLSSNSKQRSKLSTVELFRKQPTLKPNIFDITRNLSIEQLEIPPFRGETYITPISTPHTTEINLFDTNECQNVQQPVNFLSSSNANANILLKSRPSSKESVNETVIKITDPNEKSHVDMHDVDSLINSFMQFKSRSNSPEKDIKIVEPPQTDIVKKESPCKINLFDEETNRSIIEPESNVPTIEENKCCKKLSEQAMDKLMSLNKPDFKVIEEEIKTNKQKCKRLSEQAISKILSLRNPGYPSIFNNEEFKIPESDEKTPEKIIPETCKKLSEFAVDKLLSINIKAGIERFANYKLPSLFSKKKTENVDIGSVSDISLNLTDSISEQSDSTKLRATQSETSNCSLLKDTLTKPVINEDVNKTEIIEKTPSVEEECNSLVQNVIDNIPIKEDLNNASTSVDLTSKLKENENSSNTTTDIDICNISSIKLHSLNSTFSSIKKDCKNCKWISQDSVNIFASDSHSEESLSTEKDNSGLSKVSSITLANLAEEACKFELNNNEETLIRETSINSIHSKNSREPSTEKLSENQPNRAETPKLELILPTQMCDSANSSEKSCNSFNEYQANIPIIKIEKECKGTSQHRIQLISSTISNFNKNKLDVVAPQQANIIKIKRETNENSKNKLVISSLLFENANMPIKEEKLCRGSSQHNIKLVSSYKHETLSDTNLCQTDKKHYSKGNLYEPTKVQKVCKGSSQNFIKLIKESNDNSKSSNVSSPNNAISDILKAYQTIPIIKEEKICKGTSKHKIKLVSSYKKDSPNKINLFHSETDYNNNKNENITIIKEEKITEGNLHHSLKLISSSSRDTNSVQNNTIFIVNQQLPSTEKIPAEDKNSPRPATQTNLFVNVNTVNGKQNLTFIQKQDGDPDKHEVNTFLKDKAGDVKETKLSELKEKCNLKDTDMETFQNISVIFNTIQGYLENDTENLLEKKQIDLDKLKKESDVNLLIDIKSSEILSSLIHKVETSLSEKEKSKCGKRSQMDFGCQTSTLSKRILDNPADVTDKTSRTKSIAKSGSANSYHNLNLQKIALSMTVNKGCSGKTETKTVTENLAKEEKKDSTSNLSTRSSRNSSNSSYVSIHKERLEKAKSIESDLNNKNAILPNCSFLEDGYTRMHNLLGVKQEKYNTKTRKKLDSTFNY